MGFCVATTMKRLRQRVGAVVHRYLVLIHGFQQSALRLGRSAIDLIRQNDVGKNGAGTKFEALRRLAKHTDAHHVGRQQVRGELQPLEGAIKRACQRMGKGCLAHSGDVLDQQVTAREEAHQRELDHVIFAPNDALHGPLHAVQKVQRDSERIIDFGFCHVCSIRRFPAGVTPGNALIYFVSVPYV